MIIGHLAIAALIKHFAPEEETVPLLAGTVFPDVADKALKYAFNLKEGRSLFHSLFGFGLTMLASRYLYRQGSARKSWKIGYMAHLAADIEGDVPWLYPFVYYEFRYLPYSYGEKVVRLVTHPRPIETFLTLWATFAWLGRFMSQLRMTTSPDPVPGEK